jgi:LL-diaminopimelate aminotransferase
VVGGKDLIDAFLTFKSNIDSGVFMAVQRTAARGLRHPAAAAFHKDRTILFRGRRDRIAAVLTDLRYRFQLPRGSYYFWVRVPDSYDSSVTFCADLLDKIGLVVTPGVGYGPSGEKFFRISMTAPDPRIDEGMARLRQFSKEAL